MLSFCFIEVVSSSFKSNYVGSSMVFIFHTREPVASQEPVDVACESVIELDSTIVVFVSCKFNLFWQVIYFVEDVFEVIQNGAKDFDGVRAWCGVVGTYDRAIRISTSYSSDLSLFENLQVAQYLSGLVVDCWNLVDSHVNPASPSSMSL